VSSFAVPYEDLCAESPELGRVALLPWDSNIFGFNVGAYEVGDTVPPGGPREDLRRLISCWMVDHDVELLSCMVQADAFEWMAWLGAAGFVFVDLALQAHLHSLTGLPVPHVTVRLADQDDAAGIEAIAGTAFRFGRYLADSRFPKQLANDRFRHWMRTALAAQNETEFVYVSGPPGMPRGFLHATLRGTVADVRLVAIDSAENTGILGSTFCTGVLTDLRERGARSAIVRLSAGNVRALSLYSKLGFMFLKADAVYHLHSKTPRHLLPAPQPVSPG